MTWSSQVSGWSAGATASALVICPEGVMETMSQWPRMTTSSEPTRRVSTHRSRSAGVAASISDAERGAAVERVWLTSHRSTNGGPSR